MNHINLCNRTKYSSFVHCNRESCGSIVQSVLIWKIHVSFHDWSKEQREEETLTSLVSCWKPSCVEGYFCSCKIHLDRFGFVLKNPHILKITSILVPRFVQFISSDSSDSLLGIYICILFVTFLLSPPPPPPPPLYTHSISKQITNDSKLADMLVYSSVTGLLR